MIPPGTGCVHLPVPGRGMVEYASILQTYIPFVAAREKSRIHDRARILEQLGSILRVIHATSVQGFGTDFDESNNRFSFPAFAELIQSNLDKLENSAISVGMKQWLQTRVEQLLDISPASKLFHRDLLGNWGNFLIDENENVRGIIDWEFAGAGLALHFEIASLLYVLSRDGHPPERLEHDLRAVLRGYGLSFAEYQENYERDVETLVLLNSVSAIMKLADLERCGGIAKEPWRRLFAERANEMCAKSYTSDNTAKRLSHIRQLRRSKMGPILAGAKGF